MTRAPCVSFLAHPFQINDLVLTVQYEIMFVNSSCDLTIFDSNHLYFLKKMAMDSEDDSDFARLAPRDVAMLLTTF